MIVSTAIRAMISREDEGPRFTSIQFFFRLRRTRISDMAFDPLFDGKGCGKGGSALFTADGGSYYPSHRVSEVLELLLKRLGRLTDQRYALDDVLEAESL